MERNNGIPVIGVSRHRLGTDGNGVTTLVAFHGCNLRCKYCLNPEALGSAEGLRRYTPESLYEEVKVDDLYFRATGGGITFGGGEPCLQADFIIRFRELCGKDWKIRLETSLNAPFENIMKLIPVVDEWIVDIKTDDRETYERYTGQPFTPVYQHLRGLMSKLGYNSDKLVLRIPIIPGFTDANMVEKTKRNFEMSGISRFDLFTYHTERPKKFKSAIEGLTPGKAKCEIKVIAPEKLEVSDEIIELCRLNNSFSSDILSETESSEAEIHGLEQAAPLDGDAAIPPEAGEILLPGFPLMPFGPDGPDAPDSPDPSDEPEPPHLPEPPRMEFKKVFFKECPVAGLSFHLKKDDELWDELCEGAKIALVRERNNKYDRNAVAVALADDYDGDAADFDFRFILGYIPRTENAEIAALMDAGYDDKFEAEITAYHRHGNYNDRIRITIWLLSSKPEEVRPDRLRLHSLGFGEYDAMIDELQRRGTVHFRWGYFNDAPLNLPIVGEEVVMACRLSGKVVMFRMKVIAQGEDCIPFVDDPEGIHCVDDRTTFVLTNIAGPVVVNLMELYFLDIATLGKREVYDWLYEEEDRGLRELFDRLYKSWLPVNGIHMDPSIEAP